MYPMVTQAIALSEYQLHLRFDNGEIRQFDCTPYLTRGVFIRLQDKNLFAQARVAFGTVTWPGELDIAPETLYQRSVPVSDSAGHSAIA
ncbi:MAG: DUF2442 domain-containing protein [Magnetococcales bacterium]|nr:DUF2442 domain-containing protein [Magnetococcales bacterium]